MKDFDSRDPVTGRDALWSVRAPELSLARDGSRVEMEGVLVRYVDGPPEVAVLRTDDGVEYAIELPNGRLELMGEGFLTRDLPEPGDRISLEVTIRGSDRSAGLEADWWNPCVLRAPSPDRSARRQRAEKLAASRKRTIESLVAAGSFGEARREIALLRREQIPETDQSDVVAIALRMPENERPSLVPLTELRSTRPSNERVRRIDSAYGVILESMKRSELISFARGVMLGDAGPAGDECGHLDVLSALESIGVSCAEREELLAGSLSVRMEGIRRAGRGISLDERLLLNQLFRALVSLRSDSSIRFALDALLGCIGRAEYRAAGWHALDPGDRQVPLSDAPLCALAIYVDKLPREPLAERLDELRAAQRLVSMATDDPVITGKLASLIDACVSDSLR